MFRETSLLSALAAVASAQSFRLRTTGAISLPVVQLASGQVIAASDLPQANFTLKNAGVYDSEDHGCFFTPPTHVFQCDTYSTAVTPITIACGGLMSFNGSSTFYECRTGNDKEFMIYTTPSGSNCAPIQLIADGAYTCPSSSSKPATTSSTHASTSSAHVSTSSSAHPATSSSAHPATSSSAHPATSSSAHPATSSSAHPATSSSAKPSTSTCPIATPHTVTITHTLIPAASTVTKTLPPATVTLMISYCATTQPTSSSAAAKPTTSSASAKPTTSSAAAKPTTSSEAAKPTTSSASAKPTTSSAAAKPTTSSESAKPTTSSAAAKPTTSSAAAKPTSSSASAKPTTSSAMTNGTTSSAATKPATTSSAAVKPTTSSAMTNGTTSSAATKPATTSSAAAKPSTSSATTTATSEAPGSTCPGTLSGNWEYPHLIVPISNTNKAVSSGNSFFPVINTNTSTVFNFDIPSSDSGKTCTLHFFLPTQAQLQTSSFTLSGAGGITFSRLPTVATGGTTWNDAHTGSLTPVGSATSVTPGNGYTIASFPCPGGSAVSYEADATGTLNLRYFQDYNPCPIGLYITVA